MRGDGVREMSVARETIPLKELLCVSPPPVHTDPDSKTSRFCPRNDRGLFIGQLVSAADAKYTQKKQTIYTHILLLPSIPRKALSSW